MSNNNGLTSLAPVYVTGDSASNIWASKVAPTVVSPISLVSPDGTKTGIIAQNNNGNMVMYSDPAGELFLGNDSGLVFIQSSNPAIANNFLNSFGDDLRLTGTASGTITSYNSGLNIVAADKAYVRQGNGTNGQIYDTFYNPTYTISLLNNNSTNDVAYDITAVRAAGVYQVQLSVESAVPASGTILSLVCSAPPSTAVINFSCAAINAAAVAVANQDVALNTGFFTHAGGNLRVLVASSGAAWTGTWSLQLVKMG
jgi:hypothetical protein